MNTSFFTAVSGMRVAQTRCAASAHNVANARTGGCAPLAVQVEGVPLGGGVRATVQRLPEPGVDLAAEMVNPKVAAHAFGANLRVFQTADRMLRQLLNVRG